MGRVSSLTLDDSGRYYSTNPTVLIGPPDIPAAFVGKIDSNFAKFETFNNNLRIGLDSNHTATIIMGADFYNDLDQIRFGRDSGNLSPIHRHLVGLNYVYDSDLFISFAGHIDQFALTIDSTKTAFDSAFSTWVPSSDSNDRYENKVPLIEENFNYKRATARATIDSSIREVNGLFLTDSGFGYDSVPEVTFIGGNNIIDSAYAIGDNISQTLSTTVMRGEVARYQLDSAGDSNRHLYLIHSGADDGKFHNFVSDIAVINTSNNSVSGLFVKSATEINKLSNNEQNTDFTTISDDFLDFSEDNPFGDPENN